jgi:hypothetical protein
VYAPVDPTLAVLAPSLVAASVVYMRRKYAERSPVWPDSLATATGYAENDIVKFPFSLLDRFVIVWDMTLSERRGPEWGEGVEVFLALHSAHWVLHYCRP